MTLTVCGSPRDRSRTEISRVAALVRGRWLVWASEGKASAFRVSSRAFTGQELPRMDRTGGEEGCTGEGPHCGKQARG